jgi:hypothetical protein
MGEKVGRWNLDASTVLMGLAVWGTIFLTVVLPIIRHTLWKRRVGPNTVDGSTVRVRLRMGRSWTHRTTHPFRGYWKPRGRLEYLYLNANDIVRFNHIPEELWRVEGAVPERMRGAAVSYLFMNLESNVVMCLAPTVGAVTVVKAAG